MRPEKQNLTKEYLTRLNASPFFIVVDYKGLHVGHWTELRKRLVSIQRGVVRPEHRQEITLGDMFELHLLDAWLQPQGRAEGDKPEIARWAGVYYAA